jgi:hypothetical protein
VTAPTDSTARRIKNRSPPDLLVHKFLTQHGFDHGSIIARAIEDDILATIEQRYPERVALRTVMWLAVRVEKRRRRKRINISDLMPAQLTMYTESVVDLPTDLASRNKQRARRIFSQARFAVGVLKPIGRGEFSRCWT